jgi:putative membrane protein
MNIRISRLSITALFAIGALAGSVVHADDKGKDDAFIKEAIQGNLAEQKLGQLAQEKGASEGVRNFGAHLEKDHSQANKNAMETARSLGVTAPTEPNKKQRETYDRLSKLSGEQFDKEFVKDMVKDHKKDVHEYTEHSKMSNAVGTYAKETLPHLQKHLQEAESLQGNMQASDHD